MATAETGRNYVKDGRAVDYRALASRRSKPSIGDDDGGLGDSDPESSSDDDACSRKDELDLSKQPMVRTRREALTGIQGGQVLGVHRWQVPRQDVPT